MPSASLPQPHFLPSAQVRISLPNVLMICSNRMWNPALSMAEQNIWAYDPDRITIPNLRTILPLLHFAESLGRLSCFSAIAQVTSTAIQGKRIAVMEEVPKKRNPTGQTREMKGRAAYLLWVDRTERLLYKGSSAHTPLFQPVVDKYRVTGGASCPGGLRGPLKNRFCSPDKTPDALPSEGARIAGAIRIASSWIDTGSSQRGACVRAPAIGCPPCWFSLVVASIDPRRCQGIPSCRRTSRTSHGPAQGMKVAEPTF